MRIKLPGVIYRRHFTSAVYEIVPKAARRAYCIKGVKRDFPYPHVPFFSQYVGCEEEYLFSSFVFYEILSDLCFIRVRM